MINKNYLQDIFPNLKQEEKPKEAKELIEVEKTIEQDENGTIRVIVTRFERITKGDDDNDTNL